MKKSLFVVDTWGNEPKIGYRWRTDIFHSLKQAKNHICRKLAAFPRLKASLLIVEGETEKLAWLSHRQKLPVDRMFFGEGIPAGTVVGMDRFPECYSPLLPMAK